MVSRIIFSVSSVNIFWGAVGNEVWGVTLSCIKYGVCFVAFFLRSETGAYMYWSHFICT